MVQTDSSLGKQSQELGQEAGNAGLKVVEVPKRLRTGCLGPTVDAASCMPSRET